MKVFSVNKDSYVQYKYVILLTVNCILKKHSYSHSAFLVLKGLFGSLGKRVIQILAVEQFIRL